MKINIFGIDFIIRRRKDDPLVALQNIIAYLPAFDVRAKKEGCYIRKIIRQIDSEQAEMHTLDWCDGVKWYEASMFILDEEKNEFYKTITN